MKKRALTTAALVGLAGAAGAILSPLGIAQAGHTNAVLIGNLQGENEVPPGGPNGTVVGDPDGRGKVFVFGIDGDPTTLCYVLTVEGIAELGQAPGNGRAAHIHRGEPGKNGPVVANLAWPQGGNAADCLTDGEAGKFVNGGTVQEILNNPGAFYVNVHNTEFRGGALRGQLAEQE